MVRHSQSKPPEVTGGDLDAENESPYGEDIIPSPGINSVSYDNQQLPQNCDIPFNNYASSKRNAVPEAATSPFVVEMTTNLKSPEKDSVEPHIKISEKDQ